jgi:ubiquinone/menaquinone biosynthesis C-methylase UbiE
MSDSRAFIEALNLAYHEEEAAEYDGRHPEIFRDEAQRWEKIRQIAAEAKTKLGHPLTLLDVGTGTGFVPMRLLPIFSSDDRLILTDLTPAMLEKAKAALAAAGCLARVETIVTAADAIDVAPWTIDVMTMNSVLHHLPDPEKFFGLADRLLASGGLLVVSHEPNIRHFHHPVVGTLDRLARARDRFRRFLRPVPEPPFIARVNARLIGRGVIRKPLPMSEIQRVVDIHSPTAGGDVDAGRGFDPRRLSGPVGRYRLEWSETYRHFGKANPAKWQILAPFARWIERTWPDAGALFTVILRKP